MKGLSRTDGGGLEGTSEARLTETGRKDRVGERACFRYFNFQMLVEVPRGLLKRHTGRGERPECRWTAGWCVPVEVTSS